MKTKRREFFKQIFAAAVLTTARPYKTIARLVPELEDNGDSMTGIYHVKISEFPVLKELWGSVRMRVEGIPPEFQFPKIIVSRIDPEYYDNDFSTVSEWCPHEGYPIELLNDDFVPDPLFECVKGHGSLYLPDGTFYWGVSKKDLLTFKTEWDGGDNIYIEIPQLITNVIEEKIPDLSFMSEFYPNPASNETVIKFGLEKPADINISLFDLKGNVVKVLADGYKSAGEYDLRIDLSDLQAGAYFCNFRVDNTNRIVRKLQIIK
jgi:Rieske Fe-S protein